MDSLSPCPGLESLFYKQKEKNEMAEYKGEKILAQLTARLVPPNVTYPDCMCELILTEQHFYALEDNFDGTYETHLQYPIAQLETMKITVETDSKNSSGTECTALQYALTALLGLIGGTLLFYGKIREKKKFLEITYRDGRGKIDYLFFKDLQSDAKRMVNAFTKAKSAFYQ